MSDHDSVDGCFGRVMQAAESITKGDGTLQQSIANAAERLCGLDSADFPRDLRPSFAVLYEALTAEGSYDDTARLLSDERAEWIAGRILELWREVERREAQQRD